MDDLDMRILREIGTEPFHAGPRPPHPWRPESLAAKLGGSPRLMKDRLARMEKAGVIGAYEVLPDPMTLGLSLRTYALRAPSRASKAGAVTRLRKIDGVLGVVDFLDEWINVVVAFRDETELDVRLKRVQAALGGASPVVHFEPRLDRARPSELTRTDWRIVQALRGDAKKPLHRLAKSLGVTTKTVQRRLHKLSTEGAIDTFVQLDAKGFEEVLFATLKIRIRREEIGPAMNGIHGELLSAGWAQCSATPLIDDAHFDLVVAPRSARGLRDLVEKASKLPGVIDVEGHVATELTWMPEWIDAQMEAKIAAMAPQARPPGGTKLAPSAASDPRPSTK